MANLTTIERVKTYVAAGSPMIEMDRTTAAVLCELAQFGYDAHAERAVERVEREVERKNAEWYRKAARLHFWAMNAIIAVTVLVAVARAARWL